MLPNCVPGESEGGTQAGDAIHLVQPSSSSSSRSQPRPTSVWMHKLDISHRLRRHDDSQKRNNNPDLGLYQAESLLICPRLASGGRPLVWIHR